MEQRGTLEPFLPLLPPDLILSYVSRNLSYSNKSKCRIRAELQARLERMELGTMVYKTCEG